jgi:hypothetical protein
MPKVAISLGVRDGRKDRDVGELLVRLVLLVVNSILVVPHNLQDLLHDIQALIHALTHHKDASEHLQKAAVGAGGRRGTTVAGSTRRSCDRIPPEQPEVCLPRSYQGILDEARMRKHTQKHTIP